VDVEIFKIGILTVRNMVTPDELIFTQSAHSVSFIHRPIYSLASILQVQYSLRGNSENLGALNNNDLSVRQLWLK